MLSRNCSSGQTRCIVTVKMTHSRAGKQQSAHTVSLHNKCLHAADTAFGPCQGSFTEGCITVHPYMKIPAYQRFCTRHVQGPRRSPGGSQAQVAHTVLRSERARLRHVRRPAAAPRHIQICKAMSINTPVSFSSLTAPPSVVCSDHRRSTAQEPCKAHMHLRQLLQQS